MLKLSPSNWENTGMNNSFLFAPPGGGGGVLEISSDGDDRRIFWEFEIFDSGIFSGMKIWQVLYGVA